MFWSLWLCSLAPAGHSQRQRCNLKESASEPCLLLCCLGPQQDFCVHSRYSSCATNRSQPLASVFAATTNLTIQQTGSFSVLRVYSFWQLLIYLQIIGQNMKWWAKKQVSYLRHKPDLSSCFNSLISACQWCQCRDEYWQQSCSDAVSTFLEKSYETSIFLNNCNSRGRAYWMFKGQRGDLHGHKCQAC